MNEVFLNLPNDAAEWAAASGIEQIPTEYDPIRDESRREGIIIESPAEFLSFNTTDKIDIIVRLALEQKPESFQVSIGQGMYPEQWTEICSGGALENDRWLLCSLDTSGLETGLYALRTSFTLPKQSYRSAGTYFEVE